MLTSVIIGATLTAILWIIYVVVLMVKLKPYERILPGGVTISLVFLEVVGIVCGVLFHFVSRLF